MSTACSPGTFKSKQGEGFCLPCPANSRASSGASSVCSCRNGYYRSEMDSPDSACTSKQILRSTDFAIAFLKVKMLLFKWLKIVYFLSSQKKTYQQFRKINDRGKYFGILPLKMCPQWLIKALCTPTTVQREQTTLLAFPMLSKTLSPSLSPSPSS